MARLQISLRFPTKRTFQFSMTTPTCGMFAIAPVQLLPGFEGAKPSEMPKFVMIGWQPVVATKAVRRGGVRHIDLFTASDLKGLSRNERMGLKRIKTRLLSDRSK